MAGSTTNYNSSVDVYSFGIILSELLVWRNAYHNVVVKSLFKLRDMVCFQELRPTIPERLVKASPIVASLGTLQKHGFVVVSAFARCSPTACVCVCLHSRHCSPVLGATPQPATRVCLPGAAL